MTSAPQAIPRRRDATQNRESILAAARTVLASDASASIDQIAQAAGLTRRALYGHFPDRQALLGEVIAQGAERFNSIAIRQHEQLPLAAAGEPAVDPRVALAALASELWEAAGHVHALAAIALDEQHVSASAAALAPVRSRLLAVCTAGREAGVFRADLPAALVARQIEETVRGALVRTPQAEVTRHQLAPRLLLSIAGLGWQEIDALLAQHREVHA